MKRLILPSLLLLLIISWNCEPSDPKRIIGKYKILELWYKDTRTLGLVKEFSKNSRGSGGVVEPNVFAVGHNEDFIIVKQHPTNGYEGGYQMDTTITNYYIVDMNFKVHQGIEEAIGPLTREQFDSLRIEYQIQEIEFDKQFKVE